MDDIVEGLAHIERMTQISVMATLQVVVAVFPQEEALDGIAMTLSLPPPPPLFSSGQNFSV